jgi:hypothetical protein
LSVGLNASTAIITTIAAIALMAFLVRFLGKFPVRFLGKFMENNLAPLSGSICIDTVLARIFRGSARVSRFSVLKADRNG